MSAPDVLVCCDHVGRTYGSGDRAVLALYDVTCEVRAGEQIAVTGPSGSGKSTLLHVLAGLEPPSTGTIRWPDLGRDGGRPDEGVGVVFQGPSLIPSLDVVENVELPLHIAGTDPVTARSVALDALDQLSLADLSEKIPDELSGGQAQRVAIARALASRPRILLTDEPTGQLDHATGPHVVDALLHAARDLGAALVVTTHDESIASRLAARWTVEDGRLHTRGREDPSERDAPCSR